MPFFARQADRRGPRSELRWLTASLDRLRPLPDFLVIGTQKGGTSSLARYLARHPDVRRSASREVHFFDRHYDKGVAWYRSQFPRRRPLAKVPLVFEKTPRYMFHPLVAERIARVAPQVRMIALVREPSARAISAYRMEVARGRETLPLMEALRAEEARMQPFIDAGDYYAGRVWDFAYKARGHYAQQLQRYFDVFDPAQLLVLRSEDLFADPVGTTTTITRYLGLADLDSESAFPRVRPGHGRAPHGRPASLDVPPEASDYLAEYFAPHNRRLDELLGREMWPSRV